MLYDGLLSQAMSGSVRVWCLVSILVSLLAAGCATSGIENRAQEKATVFNQLSPDVQRRIRDGQVGMGFTEDMVYIAIGKPSKTETRSSDSGPVVVWIYKNMPVRGDAGFEGLRYNTDMAITPGMTGNGRPSAKYGTQTDNNLNQDAIDSATSLPDMEMGTLFVFFYNGRVFKMRMGQ